MATEADLAEKRHAYEQYLVTTHWPAANVTSSLAVTEHEAATYTLPRTRHLVSPYSFINGMSSDMQGQAWVFPSAL